MSKKITSYKQCKIYQRVQREPETKCIDKYQTDKFCYDCPNYKYTGEREKRPRWLISDME
jgi:hypothetical protein